jgi:hypothetical protein
MLRGVHDPVLSEELGQMWELCAEVAEEIQGPNGTFNFARYEGQHLVRASASGGDNFISAELRAALIHVAPNLVEFSVARARDA